eukprot:2047220-Pyramimonas_sp.AAC.1
MLSGRGTVPSATRHAFIPSDRLVRSSFVSPPPSSVVAVRCSACPSTSTRRAPPMSLIASSRSSR